MKHCEYFIWLYRCAFLNEKPSDLVTMAYIENLVHPSRILDAAYIYHIQKLICILYNMYVCMLPAYTYKSCWIYLLNIYAVHDYTQTMLHGLETLASFGLWSISCFSFWLIQSTVMYIQSNQSTCTPKSKLMPVTCLTAASVPLYH